MDKFFKPTPRPFYSCAELVRIQEQADELVGKGVALPTLVRVVVDIGTSRVTGLSLDLNGEPPSSVHVWLLVDLCECLTGTAPNPALPAVYKAEIVELYVGDDPEAMNSTVFLEYGTDLAALQARLDTAALTYAPESLWEDEGDKFGPNDGPMTRYNRAKTNGARHLSGDDYEYVMTIGRVRLVC